MKIRNQTIVREVALGVAAALLPALAAAQSGSPASGAAADDSLLEEIVITADRRGFGTGVDRAAPANSPFDQNVLRECYRAVNLNGP